MANDASFFGFSLLTNEPKVAASVARTHIDRIYGECRIDARVRAARGPVFKILLRQGRGSNRLIVMLLLVCDLTIIRRPVSCRCP